MTSSLCILEALSEHNSGQHVRFLCDRSRTSSFMYVAFGSLWPNKDLGQVMKTRT